MRKASSCLAVLGLAALALALPGAASATPTVTFKAKAVPIAGFPHTGNIFGAGAAVESEFHISSKEYGGVPPPPLFINGFLPSRPKLHPTRLPPCGAPGLRPRRPRPQGGAASPAGG